MVFIAEPAQGTPVRTVIQNRTSEDDADNSRRLTQVEASNMAEYINITLKRAAVMLANELNYPRAAEMLNISYAELREQISTLEAQLCLHIFKSRWIAR